MINPKVFDAVLMAATKETKDLVLKELVQHIGNNYDYNNNKAGHVVNILVDKNAFVTPEKVNIKWIENNLNLLLYKIEKYNIKNISVDFVDNIDCTIRVNFEYQEKINEDRDDIGYSSGHADINFIDHPEILK